MRVGQPLHADDLGRPTVEPAEPARLPPLAQGREDLPVARGVGRDLDQAEAPPRVQRRQLRERLGVGEPGAGEVEPQPAVGAEGLRVLPVVQVGDYRRDQRQQRVQRHRDHHHDTLVQRPLPR
ncbi:hypothetical protein J7S33_06655, partial [Saccharothrix algeriensis]